MPLAPMRSRLPCLKRVLSTSVRGGQPQFPQRDWPVGHFDSLDVSIRSRARFIADAIADAREAAAVAGLDGSGGYEREEALLKGRYAIKHYEYLLTLGNPPILQRPKETDPRATMQSDAKADAESGLKAQEDEKRIVEAENDVSLILGEDMKALRHELFMANRQRVWMGWRDWF